MLTRLLSVPLAVGCATSSPPPAEPVPAPGLSTETPHPPPAAPPAAPEPEPEPEFAGSHTPIPPDIRQQMTGVTWSEGCPLSLDQLSRLQLSHWDMNGHIQTGELIVASESAEAVLGVFRVLFDARFPIHKMRPAREYGGSDDASMADNNTSAFNCRKKTGGSSWSEHSYGQAIDINTVQNPYVRGSRVLPPAGAPYVTRDPSVPGLITADGPVVEAFQQMGWKWGGHWRSLKDYQHFSASGR